MAALAAIVDKSVVDDTSISLFYNTSKAQLAISLQSSTDINYQAEDTWVTTDDHYNRYILNPSSIAAAYYRGLKFVVAMTIPKKGEGETGADVQISLVSPICQDLTPGTFENNHIALGATTDGNQGWLYYLNDGSDTRKRVVELDLNSKITQVLSSIVQVDYNSSLAAWYDQVNEERHIIYEGGGLRDFNIDKNTLTTVHAGDMTPSTSIGVVYSKSTKKAYLYYCNVNQNIMRGVMSEGDWKDSQEIQGAPMVAENSQITVTQANGFNHVFYIPKNLGTEEGGDQSPFAHILDNID
ncbi:Wall-associated proteinase [Daldinia childiae]|uniref:Wall-associated proteinase n=1 Tax=Daldinia childiae TaxID=326645 RepID=UPI0014487444|nr:Wall-associated proteinase [Daldinia childiae]KAF3055932.1 Wall-associated proteinase [Daldinia childiae]